MSGGSGAPRLFNLDWRQLRLGLPAIRQVNRRHGRYENESDDKKFHDVSELLNTQTL